MSQSSSSVIFAVKEDKLNELKQQVRGVLEMLEAEKARTTAQMVYLDDTGTNLSIVHVFADADAMDIHVQGADDRSKAAYESWTRPDGRYTERLATLSCR